MKNFIFFLVAFLKFNTFGAAPVVESDAVPPSHAEWTVLLQANVDNQGVVNYQGFFNQKNKLDNYLNALSNAHPNESWSSNQRKAYWINAYNAFTVKLILENYPLQSIKDIGDPWKKEFIKIEGQTYSLDAIEHQILRKRWHDPRIHFAVNCASFSCPILQNEAFLAEKLDLQLDNATRDFINDPRRNILQKDRVQISKLFLWFRTDFTANSSLIGFINKYALTSVNENAKIEYLEYDWKLNN